MNRPQRVATFNPAQCASLIAPYELPGQTYLLHMAMPNFYFHVTTAYDILRHAGVEIGKQDFTGKPGN